MTSFPPSFRPPSRNPSPLPRLCSRGSGEVDPTRFDLRRIHTARDVKELSERYDRMAENYDDSLEGEWGWTSPEYTAEVLSRYAMPSARVLDVGAGTGLVAECLFRRGFRDLFGLDMAHEMMRQALPKKVYQGLYRAELGHSLPFRSDQFDAVISVGTMAMGHAPAHCLEELVRVTRPGGHVAYTLRPVVYSHMGFKDVQDGLEARGRWKFLEKTLPFAPMPKKEPDFYYEVWVYQVT